MSERVLRRSGSFAVHLLLGLVFFAAVWLFAAIAEGVFVRGVLTAFDLAVARALREVATPTWERALSVVSALGSREALAAATLAIAVLLWRTHDGRLATGWMAAQAGGGALNLVLKERFARPRPELADPLLAAASWSFPSAHAMGTFVLCGLGAYLLLREGRGWVAAGIIVTVLLLWCLVMAISRVYLGVHYASDVIAGIAAGAAWVALCASGFEMIRRRGPVSAR